MSLIARLRDQSESIFGIASQDDSSFLFLKAKFFMKTLKDKLNTDFDLAFVF